jgi:hypothetical protein
MATGSDGADVTRAMADSSKIKLSSNSTQPGSVAVPVGLVGEAAQAGRQRVSVKSRIG